MKSETLTFSVFRSQAVEEEDKMTPEQLAIKNVGKQVRCDELEVEWYASFILNINFLTCA